MYEWHKAIKTSSKVQTAAVTLRLRQNIDANICFSQANAVALKGASRYITVSETSFIPPAAITHPYEDIFTVAFKAATPRISIKI